MKHNVTETVINLVENPEALKDLSYYTLCKLQDFTHYNPFVLPEVINLRHEFEGVLTVDTLGNFISFQ